MKPEEEKSLSALLNSRCIVARLAIDRGDTGTLAERVAEMTAIDQAHPNRWTTWRANLLSFLIMDDKGWEEGLRLEMLKAILVGAPAQNIQKESGEGPMARAIERYGEEEIRVMYEAGIRMRPSPAGPENDKLKIVVALGQGRWVAPELFFPHLLAEPKMATELGRELLGWRTKAPTPAHLERLKTLDLDETSLRFGIHEKLISFCWEPGNLSEMIQREGVREMLGHMISQGWLRTQTVADMFEGVNKERSNYQGNRILDFISQIELEIKTPGAAAVATKTMRL